MQKHIFAVAGGDLRFVFLAESLAADGYKVMALGFEHEVELSEKVKAISSPEELSAADTVILPLPCSTDGRLLRAPFTEREISLESCVSSLSTGTVLMGGMIPPQMFCMAEKRGIEISDYFMREELAVKNAVPTAEGALAIAINELPTTIAGRHVLITGYGRLGRVLSRMLIAMKAHVTVAARKCSDMAWAETEGAEAIHISRLTDEARGCDLVFNTVPAEIFDRKTLRALRRDALIIDLASKPGGIDFEAAKELGLRVIWALSLPGKVAPETAGEIIKETVLNILQEKGGMADGCSWPR